MIELKQQLYKYCTEHVVQRVDTAQKAIEAAQESARSDTKSSAGDKYETGRAMMQQEIDRNNASLSESSKLQNTLNLITPDKPTETVQLGSLVITDQGSFYISISAGAFTIDNKKYYAISTISPIGAKLMGQKEGYQFSFNGKPFIIKSVI